MPPPNTTQYHPKTAKINPLLPSTSQNIFTTSHHHLPPAKIHPPLSTTTQHHPPQPKQIHHYLPPTKVYSPPATNNHHQPKYINHHPPQPTDSQSKSIITHHNANYIQARKCFISKRLRFFIQK